MPHYAIASQVNACMRVINVANTLSERYLPGSNAKQTRQYMHLFRKQ